MPWFSALIRSLGMRIGSASPQVVTARWAARRHVLDSKQVKNRVHLDLRPADRTREEEVDRVIGLGAKFFADFRRPDGSGWITLTDPEGNEFCILSREPADTGGPAG
ncbi:MAG TPA: VOC family protein [Streptosporangiaceae bacterium]|jgi:hypothetical protein